MGGGSRVAEDRKWIGGEPGWGGAEGQLWAGGAVMGTVIREDPEKVAKADPEEASRPRPGGKRKGQLIFQRGHSRKGRTPWVWRWLGQEI